MAAPATIAAAVAAYAPLARYSSPLGELSDDNMALDSNSDSASDNSAAPAPATTTSAVLAIHAPQSFSALNDDSDAEGDVDAEGDADVDAEGDLDYADDADAGGVPVYPAAGGSGVSSKVSVCLNFIHGWGDLWVTKFGIFCFVLAIQLGSVRLHFTPPFLRTFTHLIYVCKLQGYEDESDDGSYADEEVEKKKAVKKKKSVVKPRGVWLFSWPFRVLCSVLLRSVENACTNPPSSRFRL